MVYLDGDNDLEPYALDDFNEMEKGLYDAIAKGNADIMNNLNIVVMLDRMSGYITKPTEANGADWTDTRLYLVKPDNNTSFFASERLDDNGKGVGHTAPLGEMNMGDPSTLVFLTEHVIRHFPAEHYALILWNHGDGVRRKTPSGSELPDSKGICIDSDNGNDILFTDELQKALQVSFNSESTLDILGFDACYMAMLEIGYEYKDIANYMIASMYAVQADGWSYDLLFGTMTAESGYDESELPPAGFSRLIIDTYKEFIDTTPVYKNNGETLSATDLSTMDTLAGAVNALGVAMYNEDNQSALEITRDSAVHFYNTTNESVYYPYYDLFSLCDAIINDGSYSTALASAANNVITALEAAILYAYGDSGDNGVPQSAYSGAGADVKRGLSIFFSRGKLSDTLASHYEQQWWYTDADIAAWSDTNPAYSDAYGFIDFCTSNGNGLVEGWRELMEAWYDPSNQHTPLTY